jgi:hypothetical protein
VCRGAIIAIDGPSPRIPIKRIRHRWPPLFPMPPLPPSLVARSPLGALAAVAVRRHRNPTPVLRCRNEARVEQRQTRALRREAWNALRPPTGFTVQALDAIRRSNAAMVRLAKPRIGDALLQVAFETFHRGRIPILEVGDEIPSALARLRVRRCQKDLLEPTSSTSPASAEALRQDVADPMDLASLAIRVRPDPLDRLHQAGGPVHDHQQRVAQHAGDQVLQKS